MYTCKRASAGTTGESSGNNNGDTSDKSQKAEYIGDNVDNVHPPPLTFKSSSARAASAGNSIHHPTGWAPLLFSLFRLTSTLLSTCCE